MKTDIDRSREILKAFLEHPRRHDLETVTKFINDALELWPVVMDELERLRDGLRQWECENRDASAVVDTTELRALLGVE